MQIAKLTLFHLKVTKKQILAWSVILFSLLFLYMILFPSVKDMAQLKLENMPKALLQIIGMEDMNQMSTHTGYLSMIYNLFLIVMSIFIAIYSANVLADEEKHKTIEFLYSLNVSRLDIYLSKVAASFTALCIVIIASAVSVLTCGFINGGETFSFMDTLQILKMTALTPFVFMGLGCMLAGVFGKSYCASLASGVAVLCYMFGYLSTLMGDKLTFLKYLSPFEMLHPQNVLALDTATVISMAVYVVVMLLTIVVGGFFYSKRDLKV